MFTLLPQTRNGIIPGYLTQGEFRLLHKLQDSQLSVDSQGKAAVALGGVFGAHNSAVAVAAAWTVSPRQNQPGFPALANGFITDDDAIESEPYGNRVLCQSHGRRHSVP